MVLTGTLRRLRVRPLSGFIALAILAAGGSLAFARPAQPPDGTRARIDRLEQELRELRSLVGPQASPGAPGAGAPARAGGSGGKPGPGSSRPAAVPESPRKKAAGEPEKAAEGKPRDVALDPSWDAGGLRLRSADGATSVHVGGRMMADGVWFGQSPPLERPPVQPAGTTLADQTGVGLGIGELQDAFFIRRARFVADGQIQRRIEYKVEFDFEPYSSITFDENFVGLRDLPGIDTVRIGQTHCPFGLEAYTSSRFHPLLERAPQFEAFYNEFAPGVFTNTTFLDQRITVQNHVHRIDAFNQFNGASFGKGKYAYTGRVSGLPVLEDSGKELVHLGLAYQFREASIPSDFNGGTVLTPTWTTPGNTDLVRFRARPSLRDAAGLQGNNTRMIDTGNIIADDVRSVNAELMGYRGRLWVQSEACWAHVDEAFFPTTRPPTSRGDLDYRGVYGMAGYFLTDDRRGYDRRFGKYGRVEPRSFFTLFRDRDGCLHSSPGACEIVFRHASLDLDDDMVLGGRYREDTVGVNWYWNDNVKLQANYIHGHRDVPAPAADGSVRGLGLRAALEF